MSSLGLCCFSRASPGMHRNRKCAAEMLGISLRTLQNRIAALRDEENAKAATS